MRAIAKPTITPAIRIGYGAGDFACNAIWVTSLTYVVFYYTDVLRLPVALVALLMLIGRTANAVIDPAVGYLLDRRQGAEKARPFVKWGAVPLGLSVFLMFVPLGTTVAEKVAWALSTFLAMTVAYSVVNTAYGTLPNLISPDTGDRLKLTSARFLGASTASVLMGGITFSGVAFLGSGNPQRGFTLFMGAVGLGASICLLITWALCRETIRDRQVHRLGGIAPFRSLLANRPWGLLTLIKILNSIAHAMTLGTLTYISAYVLHLSSAHSGSLLAAAMIAGFVGCLLAPMVARRLGSRAAVRVTNIGQAICFVLIAVLPSNLPVLFIFFTIAGLLLGLRDVVIYAMLANSLDVGTARTGIDAVGSGYAVASAANKIAAGVGAAVSAALLARSGYAAGVIQQSQATRDAIIFAFATLPAGLLFLSALVTFAYPRDSEIENGKLALL